MKPRRQAWMRDELILALDLYFTDGGHYYSASMNELSQVLRAIPVEPENASDPGFRGEKSVMAKLGNFAALDPDSPKPGRPNVGQLDHEVWEEFSPDRGHLHEVASAIGANLASLAPPDLEGNDPVGLEDAPEGRILTRIHSIRERSPKLRAAKKAKVLEETGRLACEGCDLDFGEHYGERGQGFIECHHIKPLSTLKPGQRTNLTDLALLCSNCHRMVHVRDPWLSMESLIEIQQAS
jgi:5-methylcytosine-specific restriction protein A